MQKNNQQLEKTHNYFYKITNLINGKYYYGIHSTNNLNDGYMGSGVKLKNGIKKYGIKNFTKEIIADYPTRKEASDYENLYVTIDLVLDENCYNLCIGGDRLYDNQISLSGINNPFYGKKHTEETKKILSEINHKELNKFYGKKHTKESKDKISVYALGRPSPNKGKITSKETKNKISNANTGKKRSDEVKKIISEKTKGINNPFYGKNHTEETKQVIREKRKLQVIDEDTRKKMSENSKSSKPCIINNVLYKSMNDASRQLNLKKTIIKWRITSNNIKWIGWHFT